MVQHLPNICIMNAENLCQEIHVLTMIRYSLAEISVKSKQKAAYLHQNLRMKSQALGQCVIIQSIHATLKNNAGVPVSLIFMWKLESLFPNGKVRVSPFSYNQVTDSLLARWRQVSSWRSDQAGRMQYELNSAHVAFIIVYYVRWRPRWGGCRRQ